mmetsp:Transcript_6241/g.18205  ORF Transcript_6241/g.18205 Transcript_6241/m.18205 type:complete len:243 (+) Transcript_6241:602-1330(+)
MLLHKDLHGMQRHVCLNHVRQVEATDGALLSMHDRHELPEGLLFGHVDEEHGGEETHALAVPHCWVMGRVGSEHLAQPLQPRAAFRAIFGEHLVPWKGARDVPLNGLVDIVLRLTLGECFGLFTEAPVAVWVVGDQVIDLSEHIPHGAAVHVGDPFPNTALELERLVVCVLAPPSEHLLPFDRSRPFFLPPPLHFLGWELHGRLGGGQEETVAIRGLGVRRRQVLKLFRLGGRWSHRQDAPI